MSQNYNCLKSKVLFIINPISGGKKKDSVPDLIRSNLDTTLFEPDIVFTNRAYHGRKLAQKAIGEYPYVIAVGGDGTINEIASAVAGTHTVLGIIPFGSGNGLSRFLGIPMDTAEAIKNLNGRKVEAIDAAKFNRQWFFNMAGMGFDAHIAEVFSHDKTRGFGAYIRSAFREITHYKGEHYYLDIDGAQYDREAFMLSIANSSQYGNNAHVSPKASVQDGLLDVCIIKHFPLYKFIGVSLRMFTGTADKSKYVEILRGKHIVIKRKQDGPVHLDGEPQIMGQDIEIEVVPGALRIITGKTFAGEYPIAPDGDQKQVAVNQ
ncbi:MAG: diacylglycerol kinase family lipid kinase [Bacteroidetes bacterium]|nr:diacylglycerol kinase family lipid kinase [Bacteroidota bacterium]